MAPEHVEAPAADAVGEPYSTELEPVKGPDICIKPGGRATKAFEVDQEILRGIPLHWALRRPQVWIWPRLHRRSHRSSKLWSLCLPTSKLDVFLSHSWRTPGRQKILGLLLHSCWLSALLGWCLSTGLVLCLRLQGLLDEPFQRILSIAGVEYECGASYWLLLAGPVGLLGGLFVSLYFPLKSRLCFLDIACVHQGDEELLQRGISNIGGCLAVSRELLLLYHPTYFSSRLSAFPFDVFWELGSCAEAFGACSSWQLSARQIRQDPSRYCHSSSSAW